MIDIVVLQDTLNPVSAQERVKINQNWDALRRGFSSLQNQINFLSGGTEVDEIVARIEQTIQDAQTNTQNAIDNVNNNYAEKLVEINQSLSDLSTALTNSQTATNEANTARDNATNATNSALAAITEIQNVISNFSPRGDFVLGTQYYKSNIVSNGQGSSYIAIRDNINSPLTSTTNWMLLASVGRQGIQGERGETGRGFEVKGYFATIQDLENAVSSPEAGDAYGVGAAEPYDIYIYDGINNVWVNNGALQGAKGDTGPIGPQGPPGEMPDLTPIQTQLDNQESRLVVLESQENTTKADVSGLNREVAYLKLKQEAGDRIEGGTVFADDFNGSRFGFTLNEQESSNVEIVDGKLVMQSLSRNTSEFQDIEVNNLSNNNGFNSGRNLVVLDNGWLVSVNNNTSNNRIYLSVSKDKGASFQNVIASGIPSSPAPTYYAIQPVKGQNKVVLVYTSSATIISKSVIDLDANTQTLSSNIRTETSISDISLAINPNNGDMHLCYAARDSAFPSSSNIKYSTSSDNGSTFTDPVNLTTFSSNGVNLLHSSIAVVNGSVFIAFRFLQSGISYLSIIGNNITSKDITSNVDAAWGTKHIYMGSNNPQERPSICGGVNGEIHVAWSGADADVSFGRIRYSHSVNGNVWTESVVLDVNGTPGVTYDRPSVTCDSNNNIFISYNWSMGTSNRRLALTTIKNGVLNDIQYLSDSSETSPSPSSIYDPYFRYGFDIPPLTYATSNGIVFTSNYYTEVREPTLNSVLVYNVGNTDYLGAFVKFTGSIAVQGYINDTPLSSSLEANEYSFEGSIDSIVPSTLRLELSRTSVINGNDDALTRILGGRS